LASKVNDVNAQNRVKTLGIPLILAGIITFSIIASIALYSIQLQRHEQIAKESAEAFKSELASKSFYVSQLASQHIIGIKRLTELLSESSSLQNAEYDRSSILLQGAKSEWSNDIDAFFILDRDGLLSYTTNINPNSTALLGSSFSDHITYVKTKETMKTFISPLTPATDSSLRLFVASPIVDHQTGEFKGTISASIRADTFANSIEKIITSRSGPDSVSGLSLIDSEGKLMYSASQTNIGKNILSDEVLAPIPQPIRDSLVSSIKEALAGKSGIWEIGSEELRQLNSNSTTSSGNLVDLVLISYSAVTVENEITMITFLTESASLETIINQNESLEATSVFAFIYAMLGAMTAFAAAIIVINIRLTKQVQEKTNQLVESNIQLQDAAAEITEQARQLKEADVKKGEFSAMITHELKTPLVSIIGYGSMMLNGKLGELNLRQKEKLQIMYTNAERLTALIQDILDVQKLELGEMHLGFKESSANDIISESINSLRPQAEAKGIRLANNLNQALHVKCDPSRIIQVLNNLVSNAIKFSPNNSKIEVEAHLDTQYVIFSVKDKGAGIPISKHDRIFNKFYQVDTSLTRKAGGTGLGLVICKGIVEAHKGKIWFESEEGKGSIFSFTLPLSERDG
jgi:signal transduction histidine kinase